MSALTLIKKPIVIPAKAGIQGKERRKLRGASLGPGLRRGDD